MNQKQVESDPSTASPDESKPPSTPGESGKESPTQYAVSMRNVTKRFGDVLAVDNLTLDVRRGEFLTLLGPSGSGKTTTLRMIGGFETPTSGDVYIEGKRVNRTPPDQRVTRTVFQDLALFPHMTVGENIEYGLTFRDLEKEERRSRGLEALRLVDLEGMYDRDVTTLSGGQRQRVALARALVDHPPILLLDEPLGALDEKLREQMQGEIKNLHEELGITFIAVTHNQEEALTMSDRVAVINRGRLEQLASPRILYERPETEFVADFVGAANLIRGRISTDGSESPVLRTDGLEVQLPPGTQATEGEEAVLMIRPEKIVLGESARDLRNVYSTVIEHVLYKGSNLELFVRLDDGSELKIRTAVDEEDIDRSLSEGASLTVGWTPSQGVVLPSETNP